MLTIPKFLKGTGVQHSIHDKHTIPLASGGGGRLAALAYTIAYIKSSPQFLATSSAVSPCLFIALNFALNKRNNHNTLFPVSRSD